MHVRKGIGIRSRRRFTVAADLLHEVCDDFDFIRAQPAQRKTSEGIVSPTQDSPLHLVLVEEGGVCKLEIALELNGGQVCEVDGVLVDDVVDQGDVGRLGKGKSGRDGDEFGVAIRGPEKGALLDLVLRAVALCRRLESGRAVDGTRCVESLSDFVAKSGRYGVIFRPGQLIVDFVTDTGEGWCHLVNRVGRLRIEKRYISWVDIERAGERGVDEGGKVHW